MARLRPEFLIVGIPLRFSPSWVLAVALVVGALIAFAPPVLGAAGSPIRIGAALLIAVFLLGSVMLHELGHAFVARWCGIPVRRVTLQFFGGVTELEAEALHPGGEALVAIAGPMVNLLLAALLGGLWFALRGLGESIAFILAFLAFANLALALLTLLPGYPLDGGRIVRAGLWFLFDDPLSATRLAALYAQGIGWALMVSGIVVLLRDQPAWGGGLLICGWFLRSEARDGYRTLLWRERSKHLPTIGAAAIHQPHIPADRPLAEAVDDVLEGLGERGERLPSFVVDAGGTPIGLLGLAQIRAVRRSRWATVTAAEAMLEFDSLPTLAADLPLDRALATCATGRYSYALVAGPQRVPGGAAPTIGIVTPARMLRYLARNGAGPPERTAPPHQAGTSDS
jgi:Zn-dependent protease